MPSLTRTSQFTISRQQVAWCPHLIHTITKDAQRHAGDQLSFSFLVNLSLFTFSVNFSAFTSRHGTPTKSGWWTYPRERTSGRCVWVKAGQQWPPAHWLSGSSPLEEFRKKSSACQDLLSAWLDTESSCCSSTIGVRYTHCCDILHAMHMHAIGELL